MRAFAVLISGLMLASPAVAQPTPGAAEGASAAEQSSGAAATPAAAPAANEADRQICRRVIADPSSRMGARRVCMTAEQWRQSQRAQ